MSYKFNKSVIFLPRKLIILRLISLDGRCVIRSKGENENDQENICNDGGDNIWAYR